MQVPKNRMEIVKNNSAWSKEKYIRMVKIKKNSTTLSEIPSKKAPLLETKFFALATTPSKASMKKDNANRIKEYNGSYEKVKKARIARTIESKVMWFGCKGIEEKKERSLSESIVLLITNHHVFQG